MRFRRAVALLLTFSLSACWRYQALGALPDPTPLPPQTRVHVYDGSMVSLTQAQLASDTVRGFDRETRQPRVIPLAAVDSIEAKQFQVIDSILFGTAALLLFYYSVRGLGRRPIGPGGPGPQPGL